MPPPPAPGRNELCDYGSNGDSCRPPRASRGATTTGDREFLETPKLPFKPLFRFKSRRKNRPQNGEKSPKIGAWLIAEGGGRGKRLFHFPNRDPSISLRANGSAAHYERPQGRPPRFPRSGRRPLSFPQPNALPRGGGASSSSSALRASRRTRRGLRSGGRRRSGPLGGLRSEGGCSRLPERRQLSASRRRSTGSEIEYRERARREQG
jgi:hypothetical protein